MTHLLQPIAATPQDKTCTRCGACRRDTGEWFLLGYSKREPHAPPCTRDLAAIEEWAQLPMKDRASVATFRAQDHQRDGKKDAHELRQKFGNWRK